jgi:ABC-type lipoprotein export system ATPase subunit
LVPGEAEMKFVAQNFDLMPYATVAENVGKFISNINLKQKEKLLWNFLK